MVLCSLLMLKAGTDGQAHRLAPSAETAKAEVRVHGGLRPSETCSERRGHPNILGQAENSSLAANTPG